MLLHLLAIIISMPTKHVSLVRFNHLNVITAQPQADWAIFGGACRQYGAENGDGVQ
jgi:hypothetical protein